MSGIHGEFKKTVGTVKKQSAIEALKSAFGSIVHTDNSTLKSHQRDSWLLSEIEDFQGKKNPLPVAVVMPETTEQVSQVLKLCNEAGIPVVPFGGGSGVCGGIKAEEGVVILSLEKMSGLISLDKKNLTATFWAGTNGKVAEEAAEAEGLTIGHWPQSIDISTVGGWIATKAAGQYSTAYGNIEDMVMDLEVVLPDGAIINTKQAPRAAAGFDLRQLFLGTEGMHGIVTKVSFSLRELPEASQGQAFSFDTLEVGLEAIRGFIKAGWRPPVVRLYDAAESQSHFPNQCPDGKAFMLLLHEGPKDLVDVQAKNIKALCESGGGVEADAKAVDEWLKKRNKVPQFRELIEQGIVADTIEVSATWDKVPGLYKKVTEAIKSVPDVLAVGAHSSHSYRSGTNLYFTFAALPKDKAQMEETYRACWTQAMKATIAAGGSISHHHGIGRVRKDFLQDEIGAEGVKLLRKIKAAIDPEDILNSGLLPRSHPYFEGKNPIILGHRGAAGVRPENTMFSFRTGVKQGADVIESDLHLTADGEIVLMHDPNVDRTTDGHGPISAMTLQQIKILDAGYHFSPDGGKTFPSRDQGIKVPALGELLSSFQDKRINLEIKDNNQQLVEKTVDLIAAAGCEDNVLLTAENDETMKKLRAYVQKTGSRVALGASKGEIIDFIFGASKPEGVMALQVPYKTEIDGQMITVVTPELVKKAHKHGIHVHVWTINDPVEMKELLAMGVDGIFTDFPARAAEVFSAKPPKAKPSSPNKPTP